MQARLRLALLVCSPLLTHSFLVRSRSSAPYPIFGTGHDCGPTQGRGCYTRKEDSSLAVSFEDLPISSEGGGAATVDGSILWAVRATSALLSYVGIVTALDRPRGKLMVDPAVDIVAQQSTVPGAGLGLYAKRNLPRGTALGTYPGVLLKITEPNLGKVKKYPQCETYIWRFSDSKFVLDPTNAVGELDEACVGGSPGNPGSFALLSTLGLFSVSTLLCRINEPPLGKDVNVVTEEDLEKRTVTFMVDRDVYAGEEFFIDYGFTYDRSMYGSG